MKKLLCAAAAIAALAGCETTNAADNRQYTRYSVTPPDQPLTPIVVASAIDVPVRTGPRINQLGGEIPEAKPTTKVDDYGLGEIR